METLEMRRMREYAAENAERKRLTTTEKNKRLIDQIYQIIEAWAKHESKAILRDKQIKAYDENQKTKARVLELNKRRLAKGGKKKATKK